MDFLFIFAVSVAAAFALRNPLKKAPLVFYLLAVAAVIVLLIGASGLVGSWARSIVLLVQRCMVAFALFAIVMLIGVLPKESKAARWLRPIRAQLSIIAWILCLGHMCAYAALYTARALSGAMSASMLLALIVAVVLFVLLLVLGITSFNVVKRRMPSAAWKNVQRLAYPFFALAYLHVLLMLLPAALQGGQQAQTSIAIYSTVVGGYAALRLYRAWVERSAEEARAVAA